MQFRPRAAALRDASWTVLPGIFTLRAMFPQNLLSGNRRIQWRPATCIADDIPFNRALDLAPDPPQEVVPGVRRILTNNPSPFTFKGTLTYIVGRGKVAIIDPGPDDPAHIAAVLDAVRGETVTHIF